MFISHFITVASNRYRIDIAGSISPLKLSYEVGSDSTSDSAVVSSSEIQVDVLPTTTPTTMPPGATEAGVKSGGGGGGDSTAVLQVSVLQVSLSSSDSATDSASASATKERALSRDLIKKQAILNLTLALETVNYRQLISIFDAVSLEIYYISIFCIT